MVPEFVRKLHVGELSIRDNEQLVTEMHAHGINCRLMGVVWSQVWTAAMS